MKIEINIGYEEKINVELYRNADRYIQANILLSDGENVDTLFAREDNVGVEPYEIINNKISKLIEGYLNQKYKEKNQSCSHGVVFDEEKAKNMTAEEVRRKYPRFDGYCSKCGYSGIYYASYAHYIYGDY